MLLPLLHLRPVRQPVLLPDQPVSRQNLRQNVLDHNGHQLDGRLAAVSGDHRHGEVRRIFQRRPLPRSGLLRPSAAFNEKPFQRFQKATSRSKGWKFSSQFCVRRGKSVVEKFFVLVFTISFTTFKILEWLVSLLSILVKLNLCDFKKTYLFSSS